MTRTKKHKNTKPCGKECTICYPINERTSRTRRASLRRSEKKELKDAIENNL